jgi:hypothetical protein
LWETRITVERAEILVRRARPAERQAARSLLQSALETGRALGLTSIEAQGVAVLAELDRAIGDGTAMPPHEGQATFRREGDYWVVEFGHPFRLLDAKGLRYLAKLLSQPGREVHVLDLVGSSQSVGRRAVGAAEAAASGLRVERAVGVDGGDGLDDKAKAAYRARLLELREEMAEAEGFNDMERAERARIELEALTAQLSAAFGLGGRARGGITAAERARQSVTKAIRQALRRIEAEDAALGIHLARSVRTGLYCVYDPDPAAAVRWST